MKKYMTAFQMTQSMFCALPFPCKKWDENCRPYMLLFLPVIGLEIGVLWMAMSFLLNYLNVPSPIYGLLMCGLPYLATGFMHLDGFMDVSDAIGSYRDLEKRRAILKDSHVGAFAVVWSIFLILAGFAAFASDKGNAAPWFLVLIPMLSRCCSALAVMQLKPMNTSQYAGSVSYPKWHSIVLGILILGSVALGFVLGGKYGIILVAGLIGYGLPLRKSYKMLQGMNGDISGYCICISELCAVLAFALL